MLRLERYNNGTITVIPLTSKNRKSNLPLGSWINDSIVIDLADKAKKYDNLIESVEQTVTSFENSKTKISVQEKERMLKDIKDYKKGRDKILQLISKYDQLKDKTYAKVNQITTVDKSKVIGPLNDMDPITRVSAPREVMIKLDKELIKQFTKVKNVAAHQKIE